MYIKSALIITAFTLAACSPAEQQDTQNKPTIDPEIVEADPAITICDDKGNRYASEDDARAAGLPDAAFGATYCPEYTAGMHPSWDKDQDGINDCEKEGICDDSVNYSLPRPE